MLPIRYFCQTLHYTDIVVCDAPVGTAVLWPRWPKTPTRPAEPGGWRRCSGPPDGHTGPPDGHTRIVVAANEIKDTKQALSSLIQRSYQKLPMYRRGRGFLGIVFCGTPYKHEGVQYRRITLAHIPYRSRKADDRWSFRYRGEEGQGMLAVFVPAREGQPANVGAR